MDVIDRAMSIMLQDPGVYIAHFKFNGIKLFFKRGGDPKKVEKYYLKVAPSVFRHYSENTDDRDSLKKVKDILEGILTNRVSMDEYKYTYHPYQVIYPITGHLVQCQEYKSMFTGFGFELKVSGYAFPE